MTTIEKVNELYEDGVTAFRSGDNRRCLRLTKRSLAIGKTLGDETVTGQALRGLCRVALRNHDEDHLQAPGEEFSGLWLAHRDRASRRITSRCQFSRRNSPITTG